MSQFSFSKNIQIMGVVNTTPDSFSDGGAYNDKHTFKNHCHNLSVDILDIGAQSTAPKSSKVSRSMEYSRLQQTLLKSDPMKPISIDTYYPEVFRMVQDQFSKPLIFNDVSGHLNIEVLNVLEQFPSSPYVYSHNLVPHRNLTNDHMKYMYRGTNQNLLDHLRGYFYSAVNFFSKNNLSNRLILDPCFGFSKNREQNLFLLDHIDELFADFDNDQIWLIGVSKKSFIDGREDLHRSYLEKFSKLPYSFIFRVHDPNIAKNLN